MEVVNGEVKKRKLNMQIKIFPIFLILSLVIIGTFGLWGFDLISHNGHHACPIFAALGGNCSSVKNTLALTLHHLAGLQSLTQSIINSNPVLLTLFIFLAASLLLISLSLFPRVSPEAYFFYKKYHAREGPGFKSERKFLRWLAFREHSPTVLAGT